MSATAHVAAWQPSPRTPPPAPRTAATGPRWAGAAVAGRAPELAGSGDRVGITLRPALLQERTKLRGAAWRFIHQLATKREHRLHVDAPAPARQRRGARQPPRPEHRLQVDAREPAREGRDADIAPRADEHALVERLHDRSYRERVPRGDE